MSSSQVHCPRCGGVLWGRPLPAGSGHACGGCGGVWLDHAAGQRVTEILCAETLSHAEIGARASAHAPDTAAPIACPVCRTPLLRTTVGQTRVEVDYCSSHGTWFDRDELGRVAQSYATARAYGRHGSGALVAGAAVAGTGAVAGAALMASQHGTMQRATQNLGAGDVAEVAIEGGSLAFDAGSAIGDAGGAAELAGGVFEVLGGLFEGLG